MPNPKRFFWFVFLLPVIALLPFLGFFMYAKGAGFSDLVISHYPNALWIQQSWQNWREIPLWSSTILSGYPFAADPLSGLHYPLAWPAYLLPQPLGLNLMMLLHILAGGLGMWLFLRGEGLDRLPSLLGALAFEAMPKIFAHLGAGHVTLVYAVSLTSYLLLCQQQQKRWWNAGLVLGLIALADPRWAAFSGLLWLAYLLKTAYSNGIRFLSTGITLLKILGVVVLAGMLAAALLVPLADYTRLSTRSLMTSQDTLALSLPPEQLLSLLIPPLGSMQEWVLYPGAMVLVLLVAALPDKGFRQKTTFWFVLALVSLLYSFGSYIPGMAWITSLPGLDLLRVPSRALFVLGFVLAVIASYALQTILLDVDLLSRKVRVNPLPLLVGLDFLLILLSGAGWAVTRQFPPRFAWGALALMAALVLIFLLRGRKITPSIFGVSVLALLVLDLCTSNVLGLDFRPASQVLGEGSQTAAAILAQGKPARVYSPSYSIPQQTAVSKGLSLADGVDPLQLSAYVQWMERASGVSTGGYSVTVPAYKNGETKTDNKDALPDARLLGLLNVGYVASEFDLNVQGLSELGRFGATRLYQNQEVKPRAWVQDASAQLGERISAQVSLISTANSLDLDAQGPGTLVLAEISYPGWQAWLDGSPVPIQTIEGLLRGISLGPGQHHIRMVFQPVSLYAGIAISLLTVLFLLGLNINAAWRGR
jgi:hypothetical protein